MLAVERFAQAMHADDYVAQMTKNRERFLENIERTQITEEDRARFGAQPLRALVLTEDWCNDSVQFVPMLLRLAREVPDLEVRFLRRDLNRDLANGYRRKDGYQAIPVFILFDQTMREIGSMVERPTKVAEEIAAETRRFALEHPDLPGVNRMIDRMPEETRALVKANNARWRVGQFDRWQPYFFEELWALVEAGHPVPAR
jgi:hypothetical protein